VESCFLRPCSGLDPLLKKLFANGGFHTSRPKT
jgi:hypothetical protein